MKKCKGQPILPIFHKIGRSTSLPAMASKFTCEASNFTSLPAMASKFTCEASKFTSLLAMASEVTREASKAV